MGNPWDAGIIFINTLTDDMSNILTNEITWKLKTNKGENKCIRKWHINSSDIWSYVPSFVEKDQFLRFPFYNLQNNVDVLAEINLIFL